MPVIRFVPMDCRPDGDKHFCVCPCGFSGRYPSSKVNHACETSGKSPQLMAQGPGTELKALLAKFGIQSSPTCQCNAMAVKMNVWGPDECLSHLEEIVDVMESEAGKRKLPFLRAAGRLLVKKAIANARKRGNGQ